jgi:hypothetical protein
MSDGEPGWRQLLAKEVGKTVRIAIGSRNRTAHLCILLIAVSIAFSLVLAAYKMTVG